MFCAQHYFLFITICIPSISLTNTDPIATTNPVVHNARPVGAVRPQQSVTNTGQNSGQPLEEVKDEPIEHVDRTENANSQTPLNTINFMQIVKTMQDTNQMLQMIMVANLGAENFERARKVVEGVDLEDTKEVDGAEDTNLFISTAEECEKMAEYSEYRYSIFTRIKNDQVNSCIADILRSMSSKCAVFFDNDTDLSSEGLKYFFAVKIFDCYLFQSENNSCASDSQLDVVTCMAKHSDRIQIAFHEYLDEIKPLCCYFKLYNDSIKPITEIISNRLSTDIPGIWSSIKSGFQSFQQLPAGICQKYWVVEAILSQISPFPFCYCKKHFYVFQSWFIGILVLSGALYGWWKQKANSISENLGPFESPFFYYTAPCVFQANLEIMFRLFISYFWVNFPSLIEHVIILFQSLLPDSRNVKAWAVGSV